MLAKCYVFVFGFRFIQQILCQIECSIKKIMVFHIFNADICFSVCNVYNNVSKVVLGHEFFSWIEGILMPSQNSRYPRIKPSPNGMCHSTWCKLRYKIAGKRFTRRLVSVGVMYITRQNDYITLLVLVDNLIYSLLAWPFKSFFKYCIIPDNLNSSN